MRLFFFLISIIFSKSELIQEKNHKFCKTNKDNSADCVSFSSLDLSYQKYQNFNLIAENFKLIKDTDVYVPKETKKSTFLTQSTIHSFNIKEDSEENVITGSTVTLYVFSNGFSQESNKTTAIPAVSVNSSSINLYLDTETTNIDDQITLTILTENPATVAFYNFETLDNNLNITKLQIFHYNSPITLRSNSGSVPFVTVSPSDNVTYMPRREKTLSFCICEKSRFERCKQDKECSTYSISPDYYVTGKEQEFLEQIKSYKTPTTIQLIITHSPSNYITLDFLDFEVEKTLVFRSAEEVSSTHVSIRNKNFANTKPFSTLFNGITGVLFDKSLDHVLLLQLKNTNLELESPRKVNILYTDALSLLNLNQELTVTTIFALNATSPLSYPENKIILDENCLMVLPSLNQFCHITLKEEGSLKTVDFADVDNFYHMSFALGKNSTVVMGNTISSTNVIEVSSTSSSDSGSGGNPGGDNPGGDNPGGDNPGGDNTGGDNTGGDNPGGDNTGGDNTGGDNPGGDNPGGDNTGGDNTGGDNPGGDNTGGDNTGSDNTGGDNPGGDNTGGDNTGGDNTGGDNTGGDNTGGDNTGGDNTGSDTNSQRSKRLSDDTTGTGGDNTGGNTGGTEGEGGNTGGTEGEGGSGGTEGEGGNTGGTEGEGGNTGGTEGEGGNTGGTEGEGGNTGGTEGEGGNTGGTEGGEENVTFIFVLDNIGLSTSFKTNQPSWAKFHFSGNVLDDTEDPTNDALDEVSDIDLNLTIADDLSLTITEIRGNFNLILMSPATLAFISTNYANMGIHNLSSLTLDTSNELSAIDFEESSTKITVSSKDSSMTFPTEMAKTLRVVSHTSEVNITGNNINPLELYLLNETLTQVNLHLPDTLPKFDDLKLMHFTNPINIYSENTDYVPNVYVYDSIIGVFYSSGSVEESKNFTIASPEAARGQQQTRTGPIVNVEIDKTIGYVYQEAILAETINFLNTPFIFVVSSLSKSHYNFDTTVTFCNNKEQLELLQSSSSRILAEEGDEPQKVSQNVAMDATSISFGPNGNIQQNTGNVNLPLSLNTDTIIATSLTPLNSQNFAPNGINVAKEATFEPEANINKITLGTNSIQLSDGKTTTPTISNNNGEATLDVSTNNDLTIASNSNSVPNNLQINTGKGTKTITIDKSLYNVKNPEDLKITIDDPSKVTIKTDLMNIPNIQFVYSKDGKLIPKSNLVVVEKKPKLTAWLGFLVFIAIFGFVFLLSFVLAIIGCCTLDKWDARRRRHIKERKRRIAAGEEVSEEEDEYDGRPKKKPKKKKEKKEKKKDKGEKKEKEEKKEKKEK